MKKRIYNYVLASLFFIAFSNVAYSQTKDFIKFHNALAEKIYLQTTKDMYTHKETLWFRSVVTNAPGHNSTILSGVLYVELIDFNKKIVEKKLIKIVNGIGSGSFQIKSSYEEGMYLLRAYTEWNKNFDPNFIFKKQIRVFSKKNRLNDEEPLRDISIFQEEDGSKKLTFDIQPMVVDSLHKRSLQVFIELDGKRDTLVLKKNKKGIYPFSYGVVDASKQLTVRFITSNREKYTKNISLKKEYLDVQFFPESGELVNSVSSKVGFKAADINGKGKKISGKIIDEKGIKLLSFESNPLGMGSFLLNKISNQKSYFAVINFKDQGEETSLKVKLPAISDIGNVLSINNRGDKIETSFVSNYLKSDSITIQISSRGYVYKEVEAQLDDGNYKCEILSSNLPDGIVMFTVLDKSKNIMLERLYFNERKDKRINVQIAFDKKVYKQREKIRLKIKPLTKQEDILSTSVLAISQDDLGSNFQMKENILSYFLLNSDIKGSIENPGYYFNEGNLADIDALLLTQGWSKYNYTDKIKSIVHQPEFQLSVSGIVNQVRGQRKEKEIELMLLPIGQKKTSIFSTKAQVPGHFKFTLGDLYGGIAHVLIQDVNKKEKEQDRYSIAIQNKQSPKIDLGDDMLNKEVREVENTIIKQSLKRKEKQDFYLLSTKGTIALDEVVVANSKRIPKRKEVIEEYGLPNYAIDGEEIQKKEQAWSSGLYSVLRMGFANKIEITRNISTGRLRARAIGTSGSQLTFVVVDGIVVRDHDYDLIEFISPKEVVRFEVIEQIKTKSFNQLYLETFGIPKPPSMEPTGNVVAIYTRYGKGLHAAVSRDKTIKTKEIPVFSLSREYYTPKHKTPILEEEWAIPDIRSLLFWKPNAVQEPNKNTILEFYNSDVLGKIIIIVETISNTGKVGYAQTEYEIEKK